MLRRFDPRMTPWPNPRAAELKDHYVASATDAKCWTSAKKCMMQTMLGCPNSFAISRSPRASATLLPIVCRKQRLINADESRPHEVHRYVHLGIDKAKNVDRSLQSDSLVDKLLHFKVDDFNFGSPADGGVSGINTFTHNFTPISVACSGPPGNPFGMERADLPLAKAWYEHCCSRHNATCGNKSNAIIPYLKVIHCSFDKVCAATEGCLYVALSYVWEQPTADVDTEAVNRYSRFPKTTRDAMVVAIELGVPYLWVDRYCID